MASSALEEKINKIRLQNEEIRRRYEEVEADKQNAAKSNALVQLVPSDDWPERKEPPEFSAPPKNTQKNKNFNKEHNDKPQRYSGIQERLSKKDHKFAYGDGPPPDPKYNFLADSERETRSTDNTRADEDRNKSKNKTPRGGPRRRGGGGNNGGGGPKEAFFKDNRGPQAFYSKEESLPEYEAWRAERNKIDEARINRQKTAEGNWRREWDNNKISIEKDNARKGDNNRRESNNYDRRNNHYENDHSNRGHGGNRTYHGSQKNHGHQDYRRPHHEQSHEFKRQQDNKAPLSPTDDRMVTAIDQSLKVTVNHGIQTKGTVMSVKVNSPSIAGTGRVGPRQKSRVTYSSQSDAEVTTHELNNFSRQKSFDEKTASANFNNGQKPKSPFPQRKKEGNSKSPFPQRKEFRNDESSSRPKNAKTPYSQRNDTRDQKPFTNSTPKPQRVQKRIQKPKTDHIDIHSTSDNAIPSDYNSEQSLDNNIIEDKADNESYLENISNDINDTNEQNSDVSDTLDDSFIDAQSIVQNASDSHIQNIIDNSKTDESNEINNLEDITFAEKQNENNEIDNKSKRENNDVETSDEIKIKKAIKDSSEVPDSTKDENNLEPLSLNDSKVIEKNDDLVENSQEKEEENILNENVEIINFEKNKDICEQEQINDLSADNQENISNEEIQITLSEKSNVNNSIDVQQNESKDVKENESQKIIEDQKLSCEDNATTKSTEPEKNKIIEIIDRSNETNDSGFVDNNITNESIESDKSKIIETDDSENKPVINTNLINDLNKVQNNSDVTIIETSVKNDSEKKSQVNSVDTTKEKCEDVIKICDNLSAASNETSVAVEKNHTVINEEKEVSKVSEDSTKDSDSNVIKDINESLKSSKLLEVETIAQNAVVTEKNSVNEESTKVAIEKSKEN